LSPDPQVPLPQASLIRRCQGAIHRVEDLFLALLLTAMIVLASAQIFLRNLFDSSFSWGDPLLRILVLWVGLLGALAASRGNRQITVDVISRLLEGRAKSAARAVASLFTTAVCGVLAFHAGRFVEMERAIGTPAVGALPAWLFELVMPFAFGLACVRYALETAGHLRDIGRPETPE
jgi:TRAP-type C4-dicarboxylate transport system permease small subunit